MRKINASDAVDIISEQWQAQGLDTDLNTMQVVARVLRLSKALETRIGHLHTRFSLKQGEFDVLAALKRASTNSLTPSKLYQSMLLSSGAMTSRLDRLENKGLIRRSHCTQDRRSVKVSLTPEGRALIDEVAPAHFELLSKLMAGISDHDKTLLAQLLKGSLLQLESQAENAE